MTDQPYPPNTDPALVEAHAALTEAIHQLDRYDDERAVPIHAVSGALELAEVALRDEIEAWRPPPTLR